MQFWFWRIEGVAQAGSLRLVYARLKHLAEGSRALRALGVQALGRNPGNAMD